MKTLTSFLAIMLLFKGCRDRMSTEKANEVMNDALRMNEAVKNSRYEAEPTLAPYESSVPGLEEFIGMPDTIQGCGDFFSPDTVRANRDRYIFLSNLTDFAMIKIDGKVIYMHMDTAVHYGTDQHYTRAFEGNGYRTFFDVKLIRKNDEGGTYQGTLEIIHKGRKDTINIVGDSGC